MDVTPMSPILAAGPLVRHLNQPAAHTTHIAVNPRPALLLLAGAVALYVLWLCVKSRVLRRRLARAFTRSLSHTTSRGQLKSLRKHQVMARAGRSRRATRRFRLALVLSVLLFAAWAYGELHTRTH
jgi:hypothetical protein